MAEREPTDPGPVVCGGGGRAHSDGDSRTPSNPRAGLPTGRGPDLWAVFPDRAAAERQEIILPKTVPAGESVRQDGNPLLHGWTADPEMVELTGTPSPNGLEDLWAQLYLLDGGERLGKRYTQFRERYFQPDKRGSDGMVYSYAAKPGTEESILQKISDICVSMKAEDYLELPEITYHQIPVVLDAKAEKAYRELERKMVLELPEDEEEISVASATALSNKLLQLGNGAIYDDDRNIHEVHSCKIEAFLELIESLQGKPALVFYNYQHDRIRILKSLEKSKLRIRELKNTQDEDDWNAGRIDILLTHPASSAYGLNLQEGGNHVIWFGLTWNYELYTQANKRLHRQGQKERVIIHHLVCTGTRDEDVMQALERKNDVQEWVMQSLKARIKAVKEGKYLG